LENKEISDGKILTIQNQRFETLEQKHLQNLVETNKIHLKREKADSETIENMSKLLIRSQKQS
jgi:hypothetical protein